MNWVGWVLGVVIVLGLAAAFAAWSRLVAITVQGHSMEPFLHDGDRVLVLRRKVRRVRSGDVVVFERPQHGSWDQSPLPRHGLDGREWYVKRAVAVPGEPVPEPVTLVVPDLTVPADRLVVIGDGRSSVDSRKWGYVPAPRLLGVVVARLSS